MDHDIALEDLYPRPLSGAIVEPLPPGLIPARAPLEGLDVVLEPQDHRAHAADLYQVSHADEEALKIWDYLPYGPFGSPEEHAAVIRAQSATFETIFYAIRSKKSGRAVGQASYLEIEPLQGEIEIGHIWFAPELQRTRGATEALVLMMRYAMEELGYRRMQWKCNALNGKSHRAAHRLGFRFEGIHYNRLISKGRNRDTAWYSILDDEWPDVAARYDAWLDPTNFEADGTAKTSLSALMQDRPPSQRIT